MSQDTIAMQGAGSGIRVREMAHHEDLFYQRQPWSNFIREVGSEGVTCMDPETYEFLRKSTGRFFTSSRDFLDRDM